MDEPQVCHVCGVPLVGPFQPNIPLKRMPAGAQDSAQPAQFAAAQAWLCPACGLVAWVVPPQGLDQFRAELPEGESIAAQPGQPYQRRTQMLRMLRRVRRM